MVEALASATHSQVLTLVESVVQAPASTTSRSFPTEKCLGIARWAHRAMQTVTCPTTTSALAARPGATTQIGPSGVETYHVVLGQNGPTVVDSDDGISVQD